MAVTEQVEAWQMEFSRTSSSAYDGFVESLHSLTKLITAFEVATNSRFAVARTMQLFGRESDIGKCFSVNRGMCNAHNYVHTIAAFTLDSHLYKPF